MNAEIKALNRFEEAGLNAGQSKALVIGIDDLLVKSMVAFNHRLDSMEQSISHRFSAINHRFDAINHRFDAMEHYMRFQMIGTIGVIVAILLGFAGLIYTLSK